MPTRNVICVIDDNDDVRALICRILREAGFRTVEAEDGKVGVRVARAAKPALVIADMLMPEQDGIETILELKAEMPSLPIIAISGGGSIDGTVFGHLATQCGANASMAKPFHPRELVSVVRALLASSRVELGVPA